MGDQIEGLYGKAEYQHLGHIFENPVMRTYEKKRGRHLLTSGEDQHRRHNFNLRKLYVTQVWIILSLGEYILLAYLAGMERLLPWQPEHCAITQRYESIVQ